MTSREEWIKIYAYITEVYRDTCVLCLAEANHPHHIVPRSAGGSDDTENIAPLCSTCHSEVHEQGAKNCEKRVREGTKLVRALYEN